MQITLLLLFIANIIIYFNIYIFIIIVYIILIEYILCWIYFLIKLPTKRIHCVFDLQ